MTTVMMLPDDPVTPIPELINPVGIQVGDTTNIATIRTLGPTPYETPIVYIITGHRQTERLVRAAVRAAGYPEAIINVDRISPIIAPLGIGPKGSVFFMAQRAAVAKNKEDLKEYLVNAGDYLKVFRVTPRDPEHPETLTWDPVFDPDPQPVPVLRVKGTGYTEMELYPVLKRLREAIIRRYASIPGAEYPDPRLYKELDTHIWRLESPVLTLEAEKPYAGPQRGTFQGGATRDNNYLATYPNFKLRPDVDEFVVVYGVNHAATGKSTYASFSLYTDAFRWLGIGTKLSPEFDTPCEPGDCPPGASGDSARVYLDLPPDDPDAKYLPMLYAWKVALHCNGEPFCMEIPDPVKFENMNGDYYYCKYVDPELFPGEEIKNYNDEMFFIFRNYMEPATSVAPDDNELLYDRAIYFGPYFMP